MTNPVKNSKIFSVRKHLRNLCLSVSHLSFGFRVSVFGISRLCSYVGKIAIRLYLGLFNISSRLKLIR
jgi:hypothetical protein